MSAYINGLFIGEVNPTTILGGCISVYENVYPNSYEAIDLIEKQCINPDSPVKFSKAETIGLGINQEIRTNSAYDISHGSRLGDSVCQDIHNQIYTTLLATTATYLKQMNIQIPVFHEDYAILKYRKGTEYKEHHDSGTSMGRFISAIIYLNDDYEGGELEFTRFNVKIKPKAGMLILFPSNYAYAHIAHPVTKGTKYAVVTWIHDRPIA